MKNIKYKNFLIVLAVIILGGLGYTIAKTAIFAPKTLESPEITPSPEIQKKEPSTLESKPVPPQEKLGSLIYLKNLKNKDIVEIHKVDLDGKNDKLIFTDADEDFKIRLADGLLENSLLIFATLLNENTGSIWEIKIDGSGDKKQLISQISASSFASNGKKIGLITYDNIDGVYNIWTMNLDGRFKTKVLTSETIISDLIFVDDGLAFVKIDNDNNNLIVKISSDGSKKEEVFKSKDRLIHSLSYASNKFAYIKAPKSSNEDNLSEVYIYDLKNKSEKRITNDKQKDSFPIISSDGTKIAFSKNGKIWVGNVDGSNLKVITEGDQPIGFLK